MYKQFNLDLQGQLSHEFIQDLKDYEKEGYDLFNKQRDIIKTDLEEFKDMEGRLSGNQIIKKWFPKIEADIFLSHSHQDENLVICFAGWLYKKFRLTSFIDSTVWGYANDLLRIIDDKYSLFPDSNTYSYNKRNYSTSHVHMMLSTSLMKMIDNCECIIFVNTPHFFIPLDDRENSGSTLSPWIFSEILMSEILRRKKPQRLETEIALENYKNKNITESIDDDSTNALINYEPDIEHLIPLSISQLRAWQNKAKNGKEENLDILYKLTCNER